jgi:PAT family beta-lactamase induction signal transducer AmpG
MNTDTEQPVGYGTPSAARDDVAPSDAPPEAPAPRYRHPILWVPSSFFAMGTTYTMVTTAANILFANVGLPNEQAAAFSSLTGFAYMFNPIWSPLLELYKTKKFFVYVAQAVLSAVFLCIAATLMLPSFVVPLVGLLMVASLAGATQDIVSNGVYVTTLDSKRQAAFAGIQSMSWSIGPILAGSFLVLLVGVFAGETTGGPKPSPEAYAHAWVWIFVGLGILMAALSVWHFVILPPGSKAEGAPKSFGDVLATYGKVLVTFVEKRNVWKLIGFAFFYRFGLGLLDKVGPLFVLDSRDHGGLGLDNSKLGLLNGIATAAFIGGSVLGGWFVSKRGLKRSLLILCLCLNVPNVTFLYLGATRPEAIWLVGLVFVIEKLGWGFGAVGHMIYMMQQIAPGPYKTAHYSIATGVGLSACMFLTGLMSGYIQHAVGYQLFFVIVLVAAAPSILFTLIAPFHHSEGEKAAA